VSENGSPANSSTVQINSEAAAVTIISHKTLAAPTIAVSTWTGEILLYTLNHLMTAEPPVTTLWESFYACSLFIRSSSSSTTTSATQLVAGLSDGTMVVYDLEISSEGGGVKSTSRKSSGLGSRPLKLFPTQEFVQGDETIIAVGLSERMSLIFESKGRIDFSSVNKKVGWLPNRLTPGRHSCSWRQFVWSELPRLRHTCGRHVHRHHLAQETFHPDPRYGQPITDEDCQLAQSQAARRGIRQPENGRRDGRHYAVELL